MPAEAFEVKPAAAEALEKARADASWIRDNDGVPHAPGNSLASRLESCARAAVAFRPLVALCWPNNESAFTPARLRAEMKVTREEMKAARVPLPFRDYCAHILIPLNECRYKHWFSPFQCTDLRHAYEKCQYEECARPRQRTSARRLSHGTPCAGTSGESPCSMRGRETRSDLAGHLRRAGGQ